LRAGSAARPHHLARSSSAALGYCGHIGAPERLRRHQRLCAARLELQSRGNPLEGCETRECDDPIDGRAWPETETRFDLRAAHAAASAVRSHHEIAEAALRQLDFHGDDLARPDREMLADYQQIVETDDPGHRLEDPLLQELRIKRAASPDSAAY